MMRPVTSSATSREHLLHQRAGGRDLAADREDRDVQLAVGGERGAVVGGVLVEGAVELEAGSHRPRRRVGLRVLVDVGGGRVGGAGVEEVLQVLAFPALDEQLREVAGAVEREVPDPRVVAQAIEHGGARDRGVDEDQVRELVAVALGVGVRDHQADVVPGEHDLALDAEVVADERPDVLGHRALVVAARRPPGMPGAAVVRRDHGEARVDESARHRVPFVRRLREAVQEHDRPLAFARAHVVESQSGLDLGHAVGHGGECSTAHGSAPMMLCERLHQHHLSAGCRPTFMSVPYTSDIEK